MAKNKNEYARPEMSRRGCMPRFINIFDSRRGQATRRLLSYHKRDTSCHIDAHGNSSSIRILKLPASPAQFDQDASEDVQGRAEETFNEHRSSRYSMEQEKQPSKENYEKKKETNRGIEQRDETSGSTNRGRTESSSHRLSWTRVLGELSGINHSTELAGAEEILHEHPLKREQEQFKTSKKRGASKESKLLEKWKSAPISQEHPLTGELLQKQRMRRLFPRKKKTSGEEDIFDKIVVLKPTASMIHDLSRVVSSRTEEEERLDTHFSIKEVKRRLKHAMRNYKMDHRLWFLGSILHTIPNRYQKSNDKMKEKVNNQSMITSVDKFQRRTMSIASTSDSPAEEYKFQIQAKKHLEELINNLNDVPESSAGTPLGILLSLTECDLETPLPIQERERHVEQSEPDNKPGSNTQRSETSEEDTSSSSPTPHPSEASKMMNFIPTIEIVTEKPERRSPVSVLDPLFSEEDSSPDQPSHKQVESLHQVPHINFDETDESEGRDRISFLNDPKSEAEYVRRILCASGLMDGEVSLKWNSSYPLVATSLYDEVEYPSDEFPDDLRLLFDSTSEVLEAIRGKLFTCSIPAGEKLLEIALKDINFNCATSSHGTLAQITEKSLGPWMNLSPETESISAEFGDIILNEMIEEVLLQFQ
ncbi:uncharacterized protein LOC144700024 [Wolffia australiana]